jgi:hypothetical protein
MIYMILLATNIAFAQESREVRYQKETEIDFDGIDITGELIKPQGSLIVERSGTTFNPLIQLRTDWDPEMSRSVNLIK